MSVFFGEKGVGENSLVLVKDMLLRMGKLLAFQVLFPGLEELQRAHFNRGRGQWTLIVGGGRRESETGLQWRDRVSMCQRPTGVMSQH